MVTSVAKLYTPESIENGSDEQKIVIHKPNAKRKAQKKRVAAYCRVSTDKDAQLESLENQMAAFKYCKEFRNICALHHPDITIVSGGPFYTFEIARCAKEIGIPCILDFRDPWLFEYRGARSFFTIKNLASKLIELPWERRTVHAASRVVTVTEGWKQQFVKAYPRSKEKFQVIENGYDDDLLLSVTLEAAPAHEKLTLAAFGKLFYYSPAYSEVFLTAYTKHQEQIDLLQIGPEEPNARSTLSQYGADPARFQSSGFLDYREGIRRLNQADAFLLIDVRKDAIGTKIYDYIYLNKPIVYVGPKNAALARIVSQFENGFVCSSSTEVENALRKLKPGMCLDAHIDVSRYSRSAQNEKWLKVIYELAHK